MSGYRAGYSEVHSPYYEAGAQDGSRDGLRIQTCPPQPPLGMDPGMDWSAMYRRGYDSQFMLSSPHVCNEKCRKNG